MHVVTWGDFALDDAELAGHGRERFHGRVSYIATTTSSGAPRVHPVTPIVSDDRLFVFMEPTSPKGNDLVREPRFALHCGVEDDQGGGGEFFIHGHAHKVEDPAVRLTAEKAASYQPAERYVLFELRLTRASSRHYGDGGPVQRTWRPGRSSGEA